MSLINKEARSRFPSKANSNVEELEDDLHKTGISLFFSLPPFAAGVVIFGTGHGEMRAHDAGRSALKFKEPREIIFKPPDSGDDDKSLAIYLFPLVEYHSSIKSVFTSLTRNLASTASASRTLRHRAMGCRPPPSPRPHLLLHVAQGLPRPADFQDPSAERVWFANQLSDDACATHSILNVVLNCPGVDVGEELRRFREDTKEMSPVMRGLAVTNSLTIRAAHNALARPSDVRASLNSITITTFDAEKRKEKRKAKKAQHPNEGSHPRLNAPERLPNLLLNLNLSKGKRQTSQHERERDCYCCNRNRKVKVWVEDTDSDEEEDEDEDEEKPKEEDPEEETYHFIGYVPAYGKVWELDGLKSASWMDIVRPALRMKMEKYGGSGNDGSNIRFSLLAIVDDAYEKASDELEYRRREKVQLERRLDELAGEGEGQGQGESSREGWVGKVDPSLLGINLDLTHLHQFKTKPTLQKTPQTRDIEISRMEDEGELIKAWESCMRDANRARVGLEDELTKGVRANTDHIKRTWDYEPFIREFLHRLHREGLLFPLLDRDADGRKKRGPKKGTAAGTGAGKS
ncbi:hypothetical protein CPB84DRAFT_1749049 [Gymnopilus junonius]|uniref:ubiquitinyl hydrolase 1 n=1 Tax=Gymnopilus junonius TaxID=109634 RepID=A0A9P5TK10_GYMJU|nr:hypothetical protein CPB84DRAFT_1749049 [Gymnopilus junonius]